MGRSVASMDDVQKYGEMTRDIGWALQKPTPCERRASSWHGRSTDEPRMRGIAQPGGFRRHHLQRQQHKRQKQQQQKHQQQQPAGCGLVPAISSQQPEASSKQQQQQQQGSPKLLDDAHFARRPSFMQMLQKDSDRPFSHYRSLITPHSAHVEAVAIRAASKISPEWCRQPTSDECDAATVAENECNGWMALSALCLCSSFNAFMCMNFSATEAATISALGISREEVAGLYSYYLVTCMVGMTPSMWLSDRHERVSLSTGLWATTAAAWVRWWGLKSQSYGLCLLSQLLVGYGACPVSTLPGKMSHQRFRPVLRALTTSFMVQANYAGWLFGSSVPAVFVVEGSAESLVSFAFMQCIYSVFIVVAYLILYRTPPAAALVEDAANTSHVRGFVQIFVAMWEKPQFSLQLITHGLLGAIGFAAPSAIFFILSDNGCPWFVGPLANVAFIGTGVSAGVCFGYFCTDTKSYSRILKMCYIMCAASLLACAAVVGSGFFDEIGLSVALVILAAVAGFAALGFTGIAFEDLALFPDIPGSYVVWIGYIFILGIAEPLSARSADAQGFKTLGCVASVTCIIFMVAYRQGGVSKSNSSLDLAQPLLMEESVP